MAQGVSVTAPTKSVREPAVICSTVGRTITGVMKAFAAAAVVWRREAVNPPPSAAVRRDRKLVVSLRAAFRPETMFSISFHCASTSGLIVGTGRAGTAGTGPRFVAQRKTYSSPGWV